MDGQTARDPFPDNIIPESRWDPVAANIVQKVGIQNSEYDTMLRNIETFGSGAPRFDLHIFGAKLDHSITQKEHLSGFYNQSYRLRDNEGGFSYLPSPGLPTGNWFDQFTPGNMVRLSLTSTLSPTLVNRFAAGYNRFVNDSSPYPGTLNQDWATKIGIRNTSPVMFPTFNFFGTEYQGGTINRLGVGSLDHSSNGSYIYHDDLTWIHGKHAFRYGYQYARYYCHDHAATDSGLFGFSPQETDLPGYLDTTGHAFASFLLGAVSGASHTINILSGAFRQPYHAFYAMDDWKLTPKLTMNLGLRWEIIPPFYETTGRMSEVDLNVPNPGAGNLPGSLVFAGPGRRRFNNTYWKEIGPRFGIAYQVNKKMVIRTGYAMMNTPPIANNWGYQPFTYSFNGTVNVRQHSNPNGFVDDPSMYLSQPFPSLPSPLPDIDPASANGQFIVATTAKDANRPGYVQNWDFTIQVQLPSKIVLETAYVGNKGTRLWGATGVFSELDGLPARMLSMGDILNAPVSQYPQPQSFNLTWVYDLPVGKGKTFDLHWANYVIGGWRLSAIHGYASGSALQLSESGVNVPLGFAPGIRPDVISSRETCTELPLKWISSTERHT